MTTTLSGAFTPTFPDRVLNAKDREGPVIGKVHVPGARSMTILPDGSLVVRDEAKKVLWESGTSGRPWTFAALREDGEFVVQEPAKHEVGSARHTAAFTPRYTSGAAIIANDGVMRVGGSSAGPCVERSRLSSATFHMPDTSHLDSVFGLYFGKLHVTEHIASTGECVPRWRADVPWVVPPYASLQQK